jgi:hemoglobin
VHTSRAFSGERGGEPCEVEPAAGVASRGRLERAPFEELGGLGLRAPVQNERGKRVGSVHMGLQSTTEGQRVRNGAEARTTRTRWRDSRCALSILLSPLLAAPLGLVCLGCGGSPPPPPASPVAEAPTPPPPPAPPPPPPSLYERLGKRDALTGIVDELLGDVLADKRISKLFDKTRKDKDRSKQLQSRLVEELCVVAGGDDCSYDGKSMRDAHEGLHITEAQWGAFLEDLSIAMKTRNVDDAAAKELIDKLDAQTKGDIVAPPKGK